MGAVHVVTLCIGRGAGAGCLFVCVWFSKTGQVKPEKAWTQTHSSGATKKKSKHIINDDDKMEM